MPFVRGHVQYSSRFNIVIRTLWAVLSASIVSCSIICLVLLSGFISPLRFHWCSILPSQPFLGPVEFCIWYFFGGFRSLQSGCGEGLASTISEFAQSQQVRPRVFPRGLQFSALVLSPFSIKISCYLTSSPWAFESQPHTHFSILSSSPARPSAP